MSGLFDNNNNVQNPESILVQLTRLEDEISELSGRYEVLRIEIQKLYADSRFRSKGQLDELDLENVAKGALVVAANARIDELEQVTDYHRQLMAKRQEDIENLQKVIRELQSTKTDLISRQDKIRQDLGSEPMSIISSSPDQSRMLAFGFVRTAAFYYRMQGKVLTPSGSESSYRLVTPKSLELKKALDELKLSIEEIEANISRSEYALRECEKALEYFDMAAAKANLAMSENSFKSLKREKDACEQYLASIAPTEKQFHELDRKLCALKAERARLDGILKCRSLAADDNNQRPSILVSAKA